VLCGGLFYKVENTIAGFQNRMGLFFFFEALLGFMCLTSLQVFSSERILFVRERANGYYSPVTYFLSKVMTCVQFIFIFVQLWLDVCISSLMLTSPC
jgi:ABC-2 type transporter